ncbi:MAG: STAS domain-containing protein [Gammaproteobacteria bacterium]|nr:STAS domain-containing protein [Gammaproteobacteria bacterium]
MNTALLEAWRAGLFARHQWLPNIVAGIVVGIVALPLALAFAIASGARPEQGLYTAIIAGFFAAALGGSRLQISGPTGAFIVILADITARYGIDGLQIATLMAGVMLVMMGMSRLGTVMRYIPTPVVVGFTSGIAIIIWIGQWKDFFGLSSPEGTHFHQKVISLISQFDQIHPATTGLALLGLLILIVAPKIPRLNKIPAPLTALIILTAAQMAFQFEGVATIGSTFGGIPQGLPEFHLPSVDMATLMMLLAPAFTIAMLGSIESLLSAAVADGMTGTKHNPNQELIGQGISNVASPLFGGFASTGAIARTATSIRNGATSPLAGMVHVAVLVLIVMVAAPLAEHIPLAALAAILFVVAYNMSEWRHFLHIARKAPKEDTLILLITFFLTVFADLVVAVNVGVILASLLFMRRMGQSVAVSAVQEEGIQQELKRLGLPPLPQGVQVYAVDGPMFFGAVENFVRSMKVTQQQYHTLVLRLSDVPFVDITAILALEDLVTSLSKERVRVILRGANNQVKQKLMRAGFGDKITVEFYDTLAQTIVAINQPSKA